MLNLAVVPGKSVGPFILGAPIASVLSLLRTNRDIARVEVKYDESNPLGTDIVFDLVRDGVILRFCPAAQRLKAIDVYNLPLAQLLYKNKIFSAPDTKPTFHTVYARFGPSFPGDFIATPDDPQDGNERLREGEPRDLAERNEIVQIAARDHRAQAPAKTHHYHLHYPGLTFVFPIPDQFKHLYQDNKDHPSEFTDGTTPVCSRLLVYFGSAKERSRLPPLATDSFYFELVHATITEGILLKKRGISLTFHSSAQDVLSQLGSPSRVYYKDDDKMRIHSQRESHTARDYFFNYFHLGLDILFDGFTHTIDKFVLHTNFPAHPHFGVYNKCNFRVVAPIDYHPQGRRPEGGGNRGAADEDHDDCAVGGVLVKPDSIWADLQRQMGGETRPMVHKGTHPHNPFGSTYFYAYNGIVYEVMRSGHLASVCLFGPDADCNGA